MKSLKKAITVLVIICMTFGIFLGQSSMVLAEGNDSAITIDVTSFGADPTGEQDSTRAIWQAFEEARKKGEDGKTKVIVNFPKGEYQIYKDYAQKREYHTSNTNSIESPQKTIGLLIENQQNLTVEGNGSLFMMHGNMMALAVVKSKNITLHDFSWDFAVPTVSEMTVTDMGTSDGKPYTDFFIPRCFPFEIQEKTILWKSELSPYTGKTYWTETGIHYAYSVVGYSPEEEMTRIYSTDDTPFKGVSAIEKIDETRIRITYDSTRPAMQKKGMILELASSRYRETAGAFTWESENVTARKVNVHFMHGFGWLVQMSRDVYYYDCNLVPRKNSGHVTVGYADGIHASGAAGKLVIENCNFANTHDDPINLHGTFTRVEQRIDDKKLKLCYIHTQQGGFPQFHKGDKVAFFTRDTLESTDKETLYTVAETTNPGENGNNLRTMIVKFEETLPANLSDKIGSEPKYVAENVTYAPEVTIRKCTFQYVPTRGILCTTRNKVLIEDNTFLNMSMATIYLSNDSNNWYESGPIRDMTIRNNIFYIKSIGRTSWEYAPAVYVHPVTKGGGLPSENNPIHKNITIEGNTFHMGVDTVVKAESVENLTIKNNKILRTNPNVKMTLSADAASLTVGQSKQLKLQTTGDTHTRDQDNVYEFTKCKNVTLQGNTYDDGLKKYAVLSGMTQSNLKNQDADIKVAGDRKQPVSDAVSNILYESSNPEVLTVDQKGTVQAKAAGSAVIYACYPWNGTKIYSNPLSLTVTGTAGPGGNQQSDLQDLVLATIAKAEEIAVPELSFKSTNPTDKSWFFYADKTKKSITVSVTVPESVGQVELLSGEERQKLELTQKGNQYQARVNLQNGMNSYYIRITAKDQKTTTQYMLHVCHGAGTEMGMKDIKINGTSLSGFRPQDTKYLLMLDKNMTDGKVEALPDADTRVKIYVNGSMVSESTQASVKWKEGANKVSIIAMSEDGITRKAYQIQVMRLYDGQADIQSILLQEKEVLTETENVTMTISQDTVSVEIKAQNPNAKIHLSDGQSIWIGTGILKETIPVYQENPDLTVTVISPDETAKQTRKIHLEKAAAYLSDMKYEDGATVGFDAIKKDKASSGNFIRLTDEKGNLVTYEKGIGTHADSLIEFKLDGTTFSRLTGVVGVDYEKYDSEYAGIKFSILADGKEKFQTPVMKGTTPGTGIDMDIKGVTSLKLQAVQEGNNNWDAHADWADMKLISSFPSQSKMPVYTNDVVKNNDGQILVSTSAGIREGSNVLYTFVPNAGYKLKKVWINGREVPVENNRLLLKDVKENIKVTAEFEKKQEAQPPSQGGSTDRILLGQVTGLQMKKSETTAITILWNAVTGADGYEIQRKKNTEKNWSSIADITQTTFKNTKLSVKDTCFYRICPYRIENGRKEYGTYSHQIKAATKPAAPKLKVRTLSGKVKLTWVKKSGVSKYMVYRKEGKGKFKKMKTLSGRKKTLSVKTKKGITYIFYVQAVKLADNASVSSKASKKIKVKAK